jgi:hypothetical protein
MIHLLAITHTIISLLKALFLNEYENVIILNDLMSALLSCHVNFCRIRLWPQKPKSLLSQRGIHKGVSIVCSQGYRMGLCVCLKWLHDAHMILSCFLMQEQRTRLWVCVFKWAAVKLATNRTAISA